MEKGITKDEKVGSFGGWKRSFGRKIRTLAGSYKLWVRAVHIVLSERETAAISTRLRITRIRRSTRECMCAVAAICIRDYTPRPGRIAPPRPCIIFMYLSTVQRAKCQPWASLRFDDSPSCGVCKMVMNIGEGEIDRWKKERGV